MPRKATRPPARSLPGTTTRHGETLAGPPGKALVKDVGKATAKPTSAKLPPPFTCSCQPNQLGGHLRGNMRLPGQLSRLLRGGMQIFVKTLPPRHLSCLPAYMATHAPLAGRVSKQGEAATNGMGLVPVPNKAKGHLSDALIAPCPVIRGITSCHCRPFHLLCATVATPFSYKRRPEATRRWIRLFGTTR